MCAGEQRAVGAGVARVASACPVAALAAAGAFVGAGGHRAVEARVARLTVARRIHWVAANGQGTCSASASCVGMQRGQQTGVACACVRGKVAPQRPWPEHPAGQARCEQSSPDQPAWQMHLVSTQWPAPEHSLGQVAMEQSAPRHDGWQTHVPFCVHAVSFTVCHSQCQLERGAPSTRAHTPGSSRGASSPRGR